MEKTYMQRIRYRVVIEGEYSVYDVREEDLYQTPEEAHDNVIEYMYENFSELIHNPSFKLELTDLHTEEE
jgi:hypothetical protein